jgi:Calcineurin-like phosphoesterase
MGRTIFVGDVHACARELGELMARVGLTEGDEVCFVGDLVSRGPDPRGVLEWFAKTSARSVRGNHEEGLLAFRAEGGIGKRERSYGRAVQELTEEDWSLLGSLPHFLDFPEHEVRVVHAGVIPGVRIEEQPPSALLTMRYLGPHGEPIEKGGDVLWGSRYEGPPHVIFGHNASPEPQLHPWATGIDTGAVYGGRLTALVLEPHQKVPPPEERERVLVSVRAHQRYYTP